MSVTSTTNRKSYSGDAVTTGFATNPVVFFDSSDLAVSVISALGVATALTENTHYTVTGGDGSTGTVNLAGGSAPYGAPAVGVTLLILRQLPLTQPVDFVQNDGSDAEVQETAYDRLTMMVQQLNEVDSRSIKLPASETGTAALTELPVDRASKFLAFDASKNPIASSGTTGTVPVSAFMETVLDDATAADARTTLGVPSTTEAVLDTIIDAKGDLIAGTAADTPARVAVGANDTVLTADSTATPGVAWALPARQNGCVLSNNGSDATNDIDITAGNRWDSTFTKRLTLAAAMTKQLDAAWAVGTNQGMLDTGAIANTTYHIFLIRNDATGAGDIIASTTAAGPLMPSGYTYFRRIGSILRESAAIVAFSQFGNEFLRLAAVLDVDATNPGTSAVDRTLSVPTGIKVRAIINTFVSSGAGISTNMLVSEKDFTDAAASRTAAPLNNIGSGSASTSQGERYVMRTNTSRQIRTRNIDSDGNTAVRIATVGWFDDAITEG